MVNDRKSIMVCCCTATEAAPNISYGLAEGFVNNGHDVYAIVSKDIANKELWLTNDKIQTLFIKTIVTPKDRLSAEANYFLGERNRIAETFRAKKFDYVFHPMISRWERRIDRLLSYGESWSFVHDPVQHSGAKKNAAYIQRKCVEESDGVVVLTEEFKGAVCDMYGLPATRVACIPHGVMNYEYAKGGSSPVSLSSENLNFLFFGRITKYKGLHVLAEAFRAIRDEYDNTTLSIVGNGDFSEYELSFSGIDSCFVVNRYIEENEVDPLFSQPNVVIVLPYIDATQSGIIPIAMTHGLPVVATDTGGLRSQLNNGALGLYAKPGDVESLICAMRKCLEDKSCLDAQRDAMKKASSSLSWDSITNMLMEQVVAKDL